jgi:murein DD-endopeptidase MepM/ murein hydrolase activator NlpD
MAVVIAVAVQQIALSMRPSPKYITALDPLPAPRADRPISRVFVSAEQSSRVHHPRSAAFRDLWRSDAWYHPLTRELILPENSTRRFGARRHGKRPIECGGGHCGVDLGGFGMPVNSIRDGVVERVQSWSRNNAGRYVRIAHDNGFVSYYMHLHRIEPGLEVGMRVKGGDQIGITGRSGIKRSRPHLHFALAYRQDRKQIYIDPEPLLRRSRSAEEEAAGAQADDHDDSAGGEPVVQPLVLHGEAWTDPDPTGM